MAESKPIHNTKDLTECGICLCTIEEPKALPCLHTYCLKCLSKWAKGKTDTIRCPACVQHFDIPSGGIKAFRTNFFINTLKDRQAAACKLQSEDRNGICASCEANGIEPEGYCVTCDGCVCEHCYGSHMKMKILCDHKVLSYKELQSGQIDLKDVSQKKNCKVHAGQVLWFFCETCDTLICRDCTVVDHPASSHRLVNLETASKGRRKEIEDLIRCCQDIQAKADNKLKDVYHVSEQLAKNATGAEGGIDDSFKEALRSLRENRDRLKAEVETAASHIKKQLDIQKEEIETLQTRITTALQMATEVVQTGSDYDLAVIYKSLKTNLIELRDVNLAPVEKRKAGIHFKPDHIGTVQKLGSLVSKQKREGVAMWKLERSFGNVGAGKLKWGRSVATTQEGHIAVADHDGSAIKIYSKDGQLQSLINVPGSPWSAVVSSDGGLFVTNESNYVSVYDEEGNQKNQIYSKSPDNVSSADQETAHMGLAIDNNGHFLVGEWEHGYFSKHRLDGTHIMSFSVRSAPCFIAVTRDDNVVVSNAEGVFTPGVVDIYTENGLHLQTLDTPQGSSWNPWGICCTRANDILIADGIYTGAIYCYSGEKCVYIGCLTNDLERPSDLAYMDDEKTLVVLEFCGIKIFKLEYFNFPLTTYKPLVLK